MIIAGSSYWERCIFPKWDRIFGSGGRAAVAISRLSPGSSLFTYAFRGWANDVRASMQAEGIVAHVVEIDEELAFEYWDPLEKLEIPEPSRQYPNLDVAGTVVLSFGFLEGGAVVKADRVVYDPQSSDPQRLPLPSGSRAQSIAYVIKDEELHRLTGLENSRDAATKIMSEQSAEVLVARHMLGGATIYVGEAPPLSVPPYQSKRWFKIGSGDVFAAVFAHYWGEKRLDAVAAAELAARSVAYFNDGARLPIPSGAELESASPVLVKATAPEICLSGPFDTMPQIWLLDEAYFKLKSLGARVFSPFHELEALRARPDYSEAVLARLEQCAAVLAIADGGPLEANFHVGYARARQMPVVLLAEAVSTRDLTMFSGTNCEVADDLTSALYRSYLAACEEV